MTRGGETRVVTIREGAIARRRADSIEQPRTTAPRSDRETVAASV
ncbi:hypothetical protein [Natronococcus wangiae]|nr:hypothetical protein [Natronococcus sp. AD5]